MKGGAAGRSNRDISRELELCYKTVDREIRRNGRQSHDSPRCMGCVRALTFVPGSGIYPPG
jgi:hypothetical protein